MFSCHAADVNHLWIVDGSLSNGASGLSAAVRDSLAIIDDHRSIGGFIVSASIHCHSVRARILQWSITPVPVSRSPVTGWRRAR